MKLCVVTMRMLAVIRMRSKTKLFAMLKR